MNKEGMKKERGCRSMNTDYKDFIDDNKEEILQSALDAIDPDFMGMSRNQALTLAGAMKKCGFDRNDFAEVMQRSSADKGTFTKQWDKFTGTGKHGTASEGTIFEYAKQSGWKWPAPAQDPKDKKGPAKKKKKSIVKKWDETFKLECFLDKQEYKEKPSDVWRIKEREPVPSPGPCLLTVQEFAKAVTSGRTFYPTIYSKEQTGTNEKGKPIYYYRGISQQLFVVDIDNEEQYIDENKKTCKRRIKDPLDVERALKICEENEIKPFLIYETFSSKEHRADPEQPYYKFRICFALDKPLKAQEVGEKGLLKVREYFNNLFGKAADTSITDNARLIFGTDEKKSAKAYKAIIDSDKLFRKVFEQPEQKKETPGDTLPKLITIDAGDLLEKDIPPLKYVVQDILPEGFGILAAPPKTYKSFLCLQICAAVCKGADVLGRKTTKSKCLYFDLESGNRRPQSRLKAMGIDTDAVKGQLIFVTKEELQAYQRLRGTEEPLTLANGFDKVLDDYLCENPEINLVIIDVFGKIRTEQKKSQQLYNYDYADIGTLQSIAALRHVCILAVHHTNKGKDENNPFNNMGGSTGLFGASDFGLIIDKTKFSDKEAVLYTAGRDIEQKEMTVCFDADRLQWQYLGTLEDIKAARESEAFNNSHVTQTIIKLLEARDGKWQGTASDLVEKSRIFNTEIYETPAQVGKFINKNTLLFAGMRINIDIKRSNKDRIYTFKQEE